MIDNARFTKIVTYVINNLEGGYYHPKMLADGRVRDQRYAGSGETMYGIDRLAGGANNTTPAGKKFWALIDQADAANKWPWLYMGGTLAPQLKELAGEIMHPLYDYCAKTYLTPQARQIVESDDRLVFNFVYACWNGPGWFKIFAGIVNNAVAKGTTSPDALIKIAINARINSGKSLIVQGGNKINTFIDQLKKKDPE